MPLSLVNHPDVFTRLNPHDPNKFSLNHTRWVVPQFGIAFSWCVYKSNVTMVYG